MRRPAGTSAMDGQSTPTRRRFLKGWLWAMGLLALGALPVAFWSARRSKWSLLPPRPFGWTMKGLSSARIEQNFLPDGRLVLRIEHEPLSGVTPQMLVWWWRNIEGDMELEGQNYPRYLIWHPIDHIHFSVLKRLADGSVGAGSVFHIVEALGADVKHLVDVALHLTKLEETGGIVELHGPFGGTALQIQGRFTAVPEGTQITSTMTLGGSGWFASLAMNRLLIDWLVPAERRAAWLKHSVEEIGNLQFFLPALYHRHTGK
jgi:DAPG hydrolase-like protein